MRKYKSLRAVALCLLLALLPLRAAWTLDVRTVTGKFQQLALHDNTLIVTARDRQRSRVTLSASGPELSPAPAALADIGTRPSDILPDGVVVTGQRDIRRAWLGGATTRYDHAVLGDDVEASRLYAVDRDGKVHSHELAERYVFEDRYPRLVDLNDDSKDEIVVIRSDTGDGAGVVLYGLQNGALVELAASDTIGLRHRWLNIAGSADFDSDGQKEIAVVVTPHIGGTLTLLRRNGSRLIAVYQQDGFSNHEYGSRELGMSAVLDVNQDSIPDIAVPDADRDTLSLLTFAQGKYRRLHRIPHHAAIVSGIHVQDLDLNGTNELTYLLKDGTLVIVSIDR